MTKLDIFFVITKNIENDKYISYYDEEHKLKYFS